LTSEADQDTAGERNRRPGVVARLVRSGNARDFLRLAGSGMLVQALLLPSGPLIARLLGPEGRGALAMTTLVGLIASTFVLGGFAVAIAQNVARSGRAGRDVIGPHLLRFAGYAAFTGVAAACVGFVVFRLIGLPDPVTLASLAGLLAGVSSMVLVLGAMARGERNVTIVSSVPLASTAMYVAGVVVCFAVLGHASPAPVALLYIGSQMVAMALCWRFLRRPTGGVPPVDRRVLSRTARRSWVTSVNFLGLALDQIIVALVLGPYSLGLYVVAVSITNIPSMALQPVASMLLPKVAAAKPSEARRIVMHWMLAAAALDIVMVLGLEAVIDPVIRILFGSEFIAAIPTARVMILAWGLLSYRLVLTAVLQARGHAGKASAIEMGATAVLVLGAWIGTSTVGLVGAAGGFVAASAVAVTLQAFLLVRSSGR
jgi:O-antigen/teichoic acid export membrane protein